MPSAEHRSGRCEVITSARLADEQDANVRAVVDAASRTGRGYLAVRVGRVLLYLEDRVAVDARPVTALIEMEALWPLPPELVAGRPD
jgi:hypothetical protein